MRRSDVYRLTMPKGVGHEQQGGRYGVVVHSDALMPSSVVVVAPTSRSAAPADFRPDVQIAGQRTRVLVEQIRAVDARRLRARVDALSAEDMSAVDDALALVLGLD